jgi:hypothetical protein
MIPPLARTRGELISKSAKIVPHTIGGRGLNAWDPVVGVVDNARAAAKLEE